MTPYNTLDGKLFVVGGAFLTNRLVCWWGVVIYGLLKDLLEMTFESRRTGNRLMVWVRVNAGATTQWTLEVKGNPPLLSLHPKLCTCQSHNNQGKIIYLPTLVLDKL